MTDVPVTLRDDVLFVTLIDPVSGDLLQYSVVERDGQIRACVVAKLGNSRRLMPRAAGKVYGVGRNPKAFSHERQIMVKATDAIASANRRYAALPTPLDALPPPLIAVAAGKWIAAFPLGRWPACAAGCDSDQVIHRGSSVSRATRARAEEN
jgi:hypothetical protein